MALTTDSNRVVATGDSSTTRFYFNRLLYDAAHLQVYLDASLQVAGYTVGGIVDPWTANHVDFAVAPGTGVQVLLLRVVPLTQLSVYGVAGAFPAKTTEKNLDLQMMGLQQFDETLDRAITLPIESTLTAADIPDPADPLNYGLGLKIATDGSGLDTFSLSATPFTSPLTTKGDLAVFSTVADRLAVGANGALLIGASAEARGVKYFVPGTNGYVLQSDSAQTDKLIWVAPNQPANPIINGNMEIWQRGTTFNTAASNVYLADRWAIDQGYVGITFNRSTNVPTVAQAGVLFNYSFEIDVTITDATTRRTLVHKIEGYDWRHFAQRDFTVSFWGMSSKTGTHNLSLRNSGTDRYYIAEYTVNAADTWELKTVTFPASPSAGTWNYTTGTGLELHWVFANFGTPGGVVGAWTNGSLLWSNNQVNVTDNTANFFRLTGVKMELGSVATPIQFVPFEAELARAKRYYQKSFAYGTAPATNAGVANAEHFPATRAGAVANLFGLLRFHPTMRATATFNVFNPLAVSNSYRNVTDSTDLGGSNTNYEMGQLISVTGDAGTAVGETIAFHWTAESEL